LKLNDKFPEKSGKLISDIPSMVPERKLNKLKSNNNHKAIEVFDKK